LRSSDFKRWRKALGLSQKEAADALGLKRRVVQYYEKGERDGEKVSVPKTVRLACWALISGQADYHGPDPKHEAEAGGSGNQTGSGDGLTE
jgi:transcriptional regulator with XRE-family HTH domain